MTGKHHAMVGLAAGATYAAPTHVLPLIGGAALISGASALLPDLDTPKSIASKALRPLSLVVRALCLGQHRTLTHWPVLWGAVAAVLCTQVVPVGAGVAHLLVTAACLGYLSHILTDGMTYDGIPLLLPWGHVRLLPWPLRFRSGGRREFVWVVAIVLVCAGVAYGRVTGRSVCGSGVCAQTASAAWTAARCALLHSPVCGWPTGGVGEGGVRGGR